MSTPRIGIFGGTFDPPHIAHLILAERAVDILNLERVLWVPAGEPPHKEGNHITPIEHRVAMIERVTASNPHFELSTVDVERIGPHYTVDMLRIMAEHYPNHERFFLIGGDSLRDLSKWHEPAHLIDYAQLAVMERPGATYDVETLERAIPGLAERVTRIDVPLIEISGTTIREYVSGGCSVRYLVSQPVAEYIKQHDLYHAL